MFTSEKSNNRSNDFVANNLFKTFQDSNIMANNHISSTYSAESNDARCKSIRTPRHFQNLNQFKPHNRFNVIGMQTGNSINSLRNVTIEKNRNRLRGIINTHNNRTQLSQYISIQVNKLVNLYCASKMNLTDKHRLGCRDRKANIEFGEISKEVRSLVDCINDKYLQKQENFGYILTFWIRSHGLKDVFDVNIYGMILKYNPRDFDNFDYCRADELEVLLELMIDMNVNNKYNGLMKCLCLSINKKSNDEIRRLKDYGNGKVVKLFEDLVRQDIV